ncbi:uncharacterized protein V6R79_015023 [Siganus canaliculatus]
MAFGLCVSVALFLSAWSITKCDDIPTGVVRMECRDRYFMIAVEDLSFTGIQTQFEAVDDTGVFPVTKKHAAECGYTISVSRFPLPGHVELRASYFSCHTAKSGDVFAFNFNLITTREGKVVSYALNKTCSPALAWSPREVTCETNYMEVSVRNEVSCPDNALADDWQVAQKPVHVSATSEWQVVLHKDTEQLVPMGLPEAREQGYVLDITQGRLVFRMPYGQPDAASAEVNGIAVEVVHATLFSRRSWMVLIVDLIAACSMHEGSYDDGGYLMWETPEVLRPLVSGLHEAQINVGLNGELLEQSVLEESGLIVETHNGTVQIGIPYNVEGGYRKSLMSEELYEFYTFNLYFEQISTDEDNVDTRLRLHRTLSTPLLSRPLFTENRTSVEEGTFMVYLGDVPADVKLAAVHLNGHECLVPFPNTSSHVITETVYPNSSRSYTLKVPFDDPVVIQKFSREDAALQHVLDINFTLTVLPENQHFSHQASLMALTDFSPPSFEAVCGESGISFKLDHRPFDHLWEITIDSNLLTPELAAEHGYILSNDSQSLLLDVPLFTHGYEYEDVTLKGFSGTFEILVRDPDTSEVQSSIVKTCPFTATEFIMCSTDGKMTVAADLSLAIPAGVPVRPNLVDKYCRPKETDSSRALFSFPLNSCGSTVKLGKEYVTYENEIFFSRRLRAIKTPDSNTETDRVTLQCTYPVAGLYRLFSVYKFESDAVGVGRIIHSLNTTEGAVRTECRDRYFMLAADLSFAGEDHRLEAVDRKGVHPITEQYAAKCGYTVTHLPLQGQAELRASYFSCHTDNKDDETFTFKFNLIVTQEGKEVTFTLNKTCSPALPWSPKEVTCEANYMEVSVRSEVTCPSGTRKDDWDDLKPAHSSTTSDWQVIFKTPEEPSPPMDLSEARKQGYVFDLTGGRLVFRAPYGQTGAFRMEVNNIPVEVVHATLFSRQSWMVFMVELVAACSMYEGSYDDGGCMVWETPEELYPSLDNIHLRLGLNGKLLEQQFAEESGFFVERHNGTVQISIPYNAEGGFRKIFVADGLYENYVFHLSVEQILVDEDDAKTRVRLRRTLVTPLLLHPLYTENQTVLDEHTFMVYLGDVPADVELAAVHLNGHECLVPFPNTSSHVITETVYPNSSRSYTLKVPFDDPVVLHQFSREDSVLRYRLDLNYTLMVLAENESYHHLTSVEAWFADVSPPSFDAICGESGISFKLDHRPFDHLWEITVDSNLLTPELAAEHGYMLSNDSQSLLLDVPLFTHGYEYEDVTLKGFSGTFEILVRDPDTSEVQSSIVKTCPFTATEFIMCSTDGRMTVVADLFVVIKNGGVAAHTNLVDKYCRPKETDGTRALFSFPLNSCGSTVKLGKENVTYQNEIFYSQKYPHMNKSATTGVTVQCTYSVSGLHRLFSVHRFESDTVGSGSILKATAGLQSLSIEPTVTPKNTPATKQHNKPISFLPASHPAVRYIKVSRFQNLISSMRKGSKGFPQTKTDTSNFGITF